MRALPLAVALTGLLPIAGCAGTDRAETSDPPTVGAGGSPRTTAGFAKEGWFGGVDGLHARVDITGVERQGVKSVLRYSVTSLDSTTKSVPFTIDLLDPVGRELYRPTGSTSGANFAPGATREMAAEYPAIPGNVAKVTAITPGTAGEFTGIPVTAASPTPQGSSGPFPGFTPPSGWPAPSGSAPPTGGTLPTWGFSPRSDGYEPYAAGAPTPVTSSPSRPSPSTSPPSRSGGGPSGGSTPPVTGTGGNPVDLYGIVEGETGDIMSSGSSETVTLRADVLFETDAAKLSSRAKAVLDEAARQIKAKITSGPLTFTGHTDGKGADSRNLQLSKERAEAVLKELKSRLGGGFGYTASGKGKADPVAREGGADDAAARARNRRVEISYRVTGSAAGTTGPAGSTGGSTGSSGATGMARPPGGTAAAVPAAFRGQDGETVASRSARFGAAKRRLDVKPFYRDGAYIVAVFDIVNEGPGATPPDASYPHKDYPGGVFTSFSIRVPGGKDVQRAVRVGPRTPAGGTGAYVGPGRAVFRTGVGQPVRGFVYLPAPPGNVTSVAFDAGPFGKIDRVPVS